MSIDTPDEGMGKRCDYIPGRKQKQKTKNEKRRTKRMGSVVKRKKSRERKEGEQGGWLTH
jgi:hypothetical protein